ncbi:hypothetical protein JCM3775_002127 [Rhodotorula graminis]|uniref:Peptidase A1 domain-containing protein n=1 Tax=Rhodotorula graminis (strain WP1) TaxID=578459 RepID=A0A194S7R1_RHOGW|nr:uncharacterized protein RHOBADRAFT_51764 [Rhodotorula graminis WP1]KPV76768.1 hypothetical protein RHOBADRAFT_51764 [Rhodotorula graminis WP1]
MLPPTPLPFPHLVALLLSALAATASTAAPSPSPTHPSTATLRSAVPSLEQPAPEATAARPAPPGGIHLPLHRRNGHLHHLSRRSRADQEDIVRSWAVRERGRLLGKYGQSEARLRRRDGAVAASQSPVGVEARRRGVEGGEAAALERRQFGVGGALSSRTTASTTTSATAFRTAGFGTATSGTDSGSGSSTSSGTKTAPTRIPTQSSSVGEVHLVNYDADLSYYAPIGIGVPAQYLNCILDTGSADLWVASDYCSSDDGCSSTIPLYNSTLSTTALDMNTSFSVKYGSGSAQGEIFQDYVSFAGYNVSSQAFALVESVSETILGGEISGLMGLGWQPLAASSVTPFWQNLYQANALPFPGFGVSLTRYIDVANASAVEPGGSLTFGYLNASLYSSEINYLDIPAGMESYWVVRMDAVAVNGTNATSWAQGDGQMVAIDTGTTLIGGPRDVVASVYAQVEGAKAATGNYNGYYSYPCDNNVSIALTFGNITYNMSAVDFNLGPFGIDAETNRSTCLGAFFNLNFGSGSKISWVVGAAFLKNVYSVYRASPPSVGFALPPNSTSARLPSFPSNSSDPAHDGNLTVAPAGIYGPSGGVSLRTTLVPANTVTTAVQAGGSVGQVPSSGAAARFGRASWAVLGVATAAGLHLVGAAAVGPAGWA